mmetsp:Transcript_14639/g.61078  ORF Transcript_14639/g.61078 Transcript_14639/m.61078 type:complete len:203 (+) Transcript_14639:618-1226(+)
MTLTPPQSQWRIWRSPSSHSSSQTQLMRSSSTTTKSSAKSSSSSSSGSSTEVNSDDGAGEPRGTCVNDASGGGQRRLPPRCRAARQNVLNGWTRWCMRSIRTCACTWIGGQPKRAPSAALWATRPSTRRNTTRRYCSRRISTRMTGRDEGSFASDLGGWRTRSAPIARQCMRASQPPRGCAYWPFTRSSGGRARHSLPRGSC